MDEQDDYECPFFEGTEKLLEVWFTTEDKYSDADLRKIPRSAWESILKLVKCEIISSKKSEHIDAYVLSESSLFVSKDRFILKTCGTTCLFRCIDPVLYVAKEIGGFDEVLDVFYSRKNFIKPSLQAKPHSSFDDEVEVLENYFEDGAAYCMGRVNRDCWYLFTLNPVTPAKLIAKPDQTLEVIMQNLDPKIMMIFTKKFCSSAKEATIKSGIDKLIPNTVIDDYLFDPCGYSMNGLIKGGYYMTIHITPEPNCSYVSFETNAPYASYQDLIYRLIKTFNPAKFMMTLFANEESIANEKLHDYRSFSFTGFMNKELQCCHFKNYDLTYGLFAKAPS